MKQLSFTILSLFVFTCAFTQNSSVNSLKKTHDLRKNYINPEVKGGNNKDKKIVNKTSFVNPFIGTGGHGHTYPGATAPFGMMQLSPDTRAYGWDGCSGYHYSDSIIYGFSHTHLSGVGVPDYNDLLLVPQIKKAVTDPGYKVQGGYGSKFKHSSEIAEPGYYEVYLEDPKVKVRLTTTDRCGIHEYTFKEKKGKKFILIDLDHRDKLLGADIKIENKNTISGFRISQDWAKEQHFYFTVNTEIPFSNGKLMMKGGKHKLLLEFPEKSEKIVLKIGMSAVDINGAKQNLEMEMIDFDFERIKAEATQKWEYELNRIDFQSKNMDEMKIFYTALYHSFLNPNLFSDVDGRYRGRDNQIHTLETVLEQQYSVFSLWDTFRATHPLFSLIQQDRTSEFINTFLRQYNDGKELPVWELAGNETGCMIGYHSVSVIADSYMKGIHTFDPVKALEAMTSTAKKSVLGKSEFGKNGYISIHETPESVSKTLEYAYDDFCISQMAKAMKTKKENYDDIANEFELRSYNFINAFDPSTKFMRGRRSGLWFAPFDPSEVNFNYTEANSYQYSLFTPHANGVLTNLLGGKQELENWLDKLFSAESNLNGRHQVDITGLIGQYAHGNEPSHHMAYLYNYTKQPHKTQYYIDKIMREMYSTLPDGLSGNEDCGQMSSWYNMSAMGIYQIAPGNPYYEIGRPLGEKTIIRLENNKTFEIVNHNQSNENIYIQSITLNKKKINRLYLSHEEIVIGGKLEIELGSKPNAEVDQYEHAPTLSNVPENFIPVPHFVETERTFEGNMLINMNYPKFNDKLYKIKYTLDGTEPTVNSNDFKEAIKIDKTTLVKMALFDVKQNKLGVSVSNEFILKDKTAHLEIKTEFANQYAASGKNALIDGIRGGNEFRSGDWQGYYGKDLETEISFDTPRKLSEIGLSCIEDVNSWIFYPSSIHFEVSYDGNTFETAGTLKNTLNTDQFGKSVKEFKLGLNKKEGIKKIRIKATNAGKCPSWHIGAGNDSWLFADEILLIK